MQRAVAVVADIIWQDAPLQILKLEERSIPAQNFVALAGSARVGDEVLINETASALGLGTGGYDFVIANLTRPCGQDGGGADGAGGQDDSGGVKAEGGPCASRLIADGPSADRLIANSPARAARMMKLRYTPLQENVSSIEDEDSPFHEALQNATSLEGMPVVCCELHSQMPLVAAGVRSVAPDARIAYCMTDEAALLFDVSALARRALDTGLVNIGISCGQALGGDAEAITLHSGLLAARCALDADIAIVSQGPGLAGTATPFGHGGVAQAEAINAAFALGGAPIAVARLSFRDERERHRGASHHTIRVLGALALGRAQVALPSTLAPDERELVERQFSAAGIFEKHEVLTVDLAKADPKDVACPRGIEVTTMGRGFGDDPAFFWAAYAAGVTASSRIAPAAASSAKPAGVAASSRIAPAAASGAKPAGVAASSCSPPSSTASEEDAR